ncbi:MAG TPA: hypothetical protein VJA65_04315 [bacterium]|nr:hypothetical protein [bacterium]
MTEWSSAVRIVHIVAAVFMAAPLYLLIVVNERVRFGKAIEARMDGYMERIVSGQPVRCHVFLGTLILTGVAFLLLTGQGWGPLVRNWMVTTKVVLTFVVLAILTYVHTTIQPQIMALVARSGQEDVTARVWALRRHRKRFTATCLFLVIIIVLLGVRLVVPYSPTLLIVFIALAALFAWRAFNVPVPYGFA